MFINLRQQKCTQYMHIQHRCNIMYICMCVYKSLSANVSIYHWLVLVAKIYFPDRKEVRSRWPDTMCQYEAYSTISYAWELQNDAVNNSIHMSTPFSQFYIHPYPTLAVPICNFKLEACTGIWIAVIPQVWKVLLRGSRGDGNKGSDTATGI